MPQGRTRAEDVFTRLRSDILAGVLPPGLRLRYGELCGRYGASMGVLREALLRLAEQGLTRGEQQQGFQVTPLSRTDLQDLSDAREEIEGAALRRAVADGDLAWESRVLAAHHRLERTPLQSREESQDARERSDADGSRRVNADWAEVHACFHRTLLEGCANVRLKTVAESLRDAAELYRHLAFSLGHDDDRDVAAEHAAIMGAALQRDAELAAALLRAHIRRTTAALLAAMKAEDFRNSVEK